MPWQSYLLLDELHKLAADKSLDVPASAAAGSRSARSAQPRQDHGQHRRFVDQPALASLATELQRWAVEPVDAAELLRTGAP